MIKNPTSVLLVVGMTLMISKFAPGQTITSVDAERARQISDKGLAEGNPEGRKEAVTALSLEGPTDEAFSRLDKALNDKDVNVRLAACGSLTALKDNRSIALLERALKDKVPEVSFAAAKGLYELDQPLGKQVLLEILAGEKKTRSGYFASEKRDALRMMKNPGGLFKFMVKQGVGMAPVPGLGMGVSSLESLLGDSGISGRALAAASLAR